MSSFTGRPQGVAHLQPPPPSPTCEKNTQSPDAAHCTGCHTPLTGDDIGLTKKLINRGSETFFCKACLAKRFSMTARDCDELIAHFRAAGCHFFN